MGALARWGKWGNGVASKLRTPKLLTHVLPLSRPLGSAHLCLARRSLGEGGSLTSPRLRSLAASLAVNASPARTLLCRFSRSFHCCDRSRETYLSPSQS